MKARNEKLLRVALDARGLTSPVLRGMDRYVIGLTREMIAAGVSVTFLYRASEPLDHRWVEAAGAQTLALQDRGVIWWEQISLPRALAKHRFDAYHATAERGVPFLSPCPRFLTIHSVTYQSFQALIADGLLPGKLSDYLHVSPDVRARLTGMYYLRQWSAADHVLVPSEFCRSEVIRFLRRPARQVTTTYLAAADEFLQPRRTDDAICATLSKLGVTQPYVLFVGGFERHKNPLGLIRAFAQVHRQRPDLQLVVVGTGSPPAQLTDAARQQSLPVIVLSNLAGELCDLYDGCEVFATLSFRETFCLPALEAMSRGVPVVASSWGATPEVVGDAGILVDPRDEAAAAHAILRMIDEKPKWRSAAIAQAGKFSWKSCAEKTIEQYERLMRSRR